MLTGIMAFYELYLEQLHKDFPTTSKNHDTSKLLNRNLISSQKFEISIDAIQNIRKFVTAIYKLRDAPEYQDRILTTHPLFREPGFIKPKNYSALMSFDFHLAPQPKLIEINTNASSSLIITESYKTQKMKNIFENDFEKDIVACFEKEFKLWSPSRKLKAIAIVDENPSEQKLYLEFLMYQELFTRAGYRCVIADPKDLTLRDDKLFYAELEIDLVYNRHTDFYFSTPECKHLREAYSKAYACFSPHPFEYAMLADKQRLFEFSTAAEILASLTKSEQALIHEVLLKSHDVSTSQDQEWFWTNKKSLFFKPKRSFGGKASYRGQGVTQGVFANIKAGEYLAQEFAPPSEVEAKLEDDSVTTFKTDLRFYVYQGRVQQGVARLWRGQMTNINSLGGGLTPLFQKS